MKRKSCSSYQKYSSTITQIFNWIFKKDCWFYLKKIISQSWLFICIHCRLVLNPSNLAQVITGAHIAIRNLKRSSICSITLESIPVNNPSNVPTVQRNSRTNIIGPNIFEIFILMIHIKFKIEHHLLLCKREGFIEIVLMKYYQIFNKWLNVDNKKLLDLFKFLIKLGIYHILNILLCFWCQISSLVADQIWSRWLQMSLLLQEICHWIQLEKSHASSYWRTTLFLSVLLKKIHTSQQSHISH